MSYLDNAATTKIDPVVLDEMMPYLTEEYGNASTIYGIGRNARQAVDKAREQVANMIGASNPESIIFTSGGTESNNTVMLRSVIDSDSVIAISSVEHDSIEMSATDSGFRVVKINVNGDGTINKASFDNVVNNNKVGIISVMYVNNEIGSINDVKCIGEFCNDNGILFHMDCVQAPGCVDINVEDIGCDFASLSSHKIHGPKGVGALYIRDFSKIKPLIVGGKSQEFGFRGGTENVPGIVGFGIACEITKKSDNLEQILFIKHVFCEELIEAMERKNLVSLLHFNGNSDKNLSKIVNFRIDSVDAETMILILGSFGIYVSAGSACKSAEHSPSSVLKAIGLTDNQAMDSLRVSFSRFSTETDARVAAMMIANCADILYNSVKH